MTKKKFHLQQIAISDTTILYSLLRMIDFTLVEWQFICVNIADFICINMGMEPAARTSNWVLNLVVAVYMTLKDVFPKKGFAKYILRADIVDKNGDDAKLWQRIVRNIPLAIPFFYIVEIFVALWASTVYDTPRRLGDFIAGTHVIPSSQRYAFKRNLESKKLRETLDEKGMLTNDDDIFELYRKRDDDDHLQ